MLSIDKTVLVIYDIADNKRRRKISKILESLGTRIQESAFICFLTSAETTTMCKRLERLIDIQSDKLNVYKMNSQNSFYLFGNQQELTNPSFEVI